MPGLDTLLARADSDRGQWMTGVESEDPKLKSSGLALARLTLGRCRTSGVAVRRGLS